MLGLGDADGNERNYSANFRYQMIPFWLHLFCNGNHNEGKHL
ncbi:hypothetical protein HanXRQr2_Chr17g0782101 [Helianthus annuus]|uniref:Uncharacterized protein n=1 Tax=Helianthus annuus TaxID=4232 RepID=A0A9K3DDT4_HELAN|nr:hypothetical protein HanXRQr2_Chr17g0782101 [Helianthus annuus]KAJ0811397.1 hypothetical protein HanPSC8_Chr17g0750261 [Helianthus annuus]